MAKQRIIFKLKNEEERHDLAMLSRDIVEIQRRFTGAQAILSAELRALAQKYGVAPTEGLTFNFDEMAFVVPIKEG